MNDITILGIDLAKNTFQVIGVDKHHKVVKKQRCSREKLRKLISELPKCRILMESCGTSNYWGREFERLGHEVKLISPQHVTPYVANHKNDYKDTEAIIEVGTRPRTKFVSIKTLEQQDMQSVLRYRDRLISQRISLSNQIRGLLLEYGVVIVPGFKALTVKICELLDANNLELTVQMKELLSDSYEEFKDLSARIEKYKQKVELMSDQSPYCTLLRSIPGVGPISALALYASLGNGSQFKNGREMAAHIGLVPKQHSSGDRHVLLGITKKGNADLKQLLIHGGRAVVRTVSKKTDKRSNWVKHLLTKKHKNIVAVAVANRTARIAWAVLQSAKPFNGDHCDMNKGDTSYPPLDNSLHNKGGLRELSNRG